MATNLKPNPVVQGNASKSSDKDEPRDPIRGEKKTNPVK